MLTLSDAQEAVLQGSDYQVIGRLKVANADGTMIDYSDWLIEASGTDDIDASCERATFTLAREDGDSGLLSLSPLMDGSTLNVDDSGVTAPALNLVRAVTFETAQIPLGAEPTDDDYVEVFRGVVDRIEFADNVVLTCRDQGGILEDWAIEAEREYEAGTALADLLQAILTDNVTGVTLTVEDDEGAGLEEKYVQSRGKVLPVLSDLAGKAGQRVRYRYNSSGVSVLTLFTPERDSPTATWTLGPDDYAAVRRLDIEIYDVRTKCVVYYTDASTGTRASVTSEAPSTLTDEFGAYRAIIIEEPSDSMIQTETQAQAFADSVRKDLQEPFANQEVETYWSPHIQLWDYLEFSANNVHYDSTQNGAVVARRWVYSRDRHRHWFLTRGKPAGAYKRHLLREFGGAPADPPVVEPRPSQSGSTGTLTLAIDDPSSRVEEVWFKSVATP
ncbi:MAG TPA: hypothetical protein VF167_02960, partial [Longimicrobiaceae bacterium]